MAPTPGTPISPALVGLAAELRAAAADERSATEARDEAARLERTDAAEERGSTEARVVVAGIKTVAAEPEAADPLLVPLVDTAGWVAVPTDAVLRVEREET